MAEPKPEVRTKPRSYRPNEAELEEDPRIDTMWDKLAHAALIQIKVVQDPTR